ncbi:unnamed protein product [Fraxinus pennsylvanica]|uniref:Pentatricopeptide repeat-containing protein n=1 Tax=Fraxinus pennsylvanica TaxID=56036 RepID=A0AAD1Z6W0_9LAMI|nr:unnamed protein product [Fraxinus pennsylvanica]
MITEGCYPSPKIFNSLVHAYCKFGDYSHAYKLLKKMADCGYQPGYVVYNILIGSICGNEESPSPGVLELAEKAYSDMLDVGIVLNKVNVSNFARCLCGVGNANVPEASTIPENDLDETQGDVGTHLSIASSYPNGGSGFFEFQICVLLIYVFFVLALQGTRSN